MDARAFLASCTRRTSARSAGWQVAVAAHGVVAPPWIFSSPFLLLNFLEIDFRREAPD